MFIDAPKRGRYAVAAVVVVPTKLNRTCTAVQAMQRLGTRRVHSRSEGDAFRRKFLARGNEPQVTARIFTARERTDLDSRRRIFTQLVGDLGEAGASRVADIVTDVIDL